MGWDASVPGFVPGALSPLDTSGAVHDLLDFARKDHTRFGTGWSIDDICGSIGTGEMALMWARSSAGKSTWYLNLVNNTPHVPTLVVNMEMTPRRQMEWLVSMSSDLSVPGREVEEVLRWGNEDPRFPELMSALEQMPDRFPNLHFVSPSRPTVNDLAVILDDIEASTGTRPLRIIIDHLGLMSGAEDGYQGYARLTAGLHSWCLKEDLALIVLQQVGRGGGDAGRNDGHQAITFSSGLYTGEADADWVYGLYRPDRNPKFKKSRYEYADP
jgi:replicative DNA helicase